MFDLDALAAVHMCQPYALILSRMSGHFRAVAATHLGLTRIDDTAKTPFQQYVSWCPDAHRTSAIAYDRNDASATTKLFLCLQHHDPPERAATVVSF